MVGIYGWASASYISHLGIIRQDLTVCRPTTDDSLAENQTNSNFESFAKSTIEMEIEEEESKVRKKNTLIAMLSALAVFILLMVLFCVVLCIRSHQLRKANMVIEFSEY